MGFPIGLYRVLLGALIAFPLLLPVLPTEMLLYPREITQSSRRVVVHARRLGTHVDPLLHLLARPLPKLPRKIVTPPMELQILIPLKPFVANFAHESVRGHQGLRRQSNHLRIWICRNPQTNCHKINEFNNYNLKKLIWVSTYWYRAFQEGFAFS